MDRLTNDMTRLRAEIGNLRAARVSLMKDVQNSAIRNRDAVEEMTKDFRRQHARMAKRSKSERLAFLSGVSRQVSAIRKDTAGLRDAFRADILGGHKAWIGTAAETSEAPQREGRKKRVAA
ncbi:MAG: hypothetical protein HY646_13390 [Acidobacteria bacterium]|nr:hypothetical protein [Acidobacteriota bacterium]